MAKRPSPPKERLKKDSVWIELERPFDKEHADAICAKANNMLKRLAHEPLDGRGFSWSEVRREYRYSDGIGFISLIDSGHWFNLDYFGRPLDESSTPT